MEAGKTIVMGLLERHGIDKSQKIIDTIGEEKKSKKASRVKVTVVPNTKKATVQKEVKENVKAEAKSSPMNWQAMPGLLLSTSMRS